MSSLNTFVTRKGYAQNAVTEKVRDDQVQNNEGAYVFKISDMDRVDRFLLLGTDGTYYQPGKELTKENGEFLINLFEDDEAHALVVDRIVDVSVNGRAPKQDPALFALALASSYGSTASKQNALSHLSEVARTGTALFKFVKYVQQFRGWGRSLRNAVAGWYENKSTDSLGYQAVKYRNREGFTHRDVLRLSHPENLNSEMANWILGNEYDAEQLPRVIQGFEKARLAEVKDLPGIIADHGLSWEMIPTEALNDVKVWEALLDGNVPLGALIRQLPRLTQIGLVAPLSPWTKEISNRLTNSEELKKARIHPINLLVAFHTYRAGNSIRGNSSWTPVPAIEASLEKAFYESFNYVESAGKNFMVGIDISGSMAYYECSGVPLEPATVASAMAITLHRSEPNTYVIGFDKRVKHIGINSSDTLQSAYAKLYSGGFGATNPSAMFRHAIEKKIPVDTFVVITDNEVNSGYHVAETLEEYRRVMNRPDAKFIVIATTATNFSIGDSNDPNTLNIGGFDTSIPKIITEFSK